MPSTSIAANLETNRWPELPATPYHPEPALIPKHSREVKGKIRNSYFKREWFQQYPWLHYSEELHGVICFRCSAMCRRPGASNFTSQVSPAFAWKGFKNWNDAPHKFEAHTRCKTHTVETIGDSEGGRLLRQVCVTNRREQDLNKRCLRTIISTIQFLARQGLSLRGKTDDSGNLHQALKMRTEDIPELKGWMEKRVSWTSPKIQNELLHLLAREVSLQIRDDVVGRPFSVICDGTTDVSGAEQECVCVRFVDRHRQIREEFLCVVEPPDTCGATLAAMLEGVLKGYSLDLKYLRGQAYDGAANMAGAYNGTQAIIKRTQPLALYLHCSAHCVNLVTEALCQASSIIRNALGVCNEIGTLVSSSHTLRRLLAASSTDTPYIKLRPLCPTRWTVRGQSVRALLGQLDTVIPALEDMQNTKGTCLAMSNSLRSGLVIYGLVAADRILHIMELCSRTCQKRVPR